MSFRTPYLMFLGDAADELAAKTAIGVRDWRPEWCVGQMRLDGCNADLGLPDMSVSEAVEKGCGTMIVGVANRGGIISEIWADAIVAGVEAGMDIASGLHQKLSSNPKIKDAAEKHGRTLIDVRHPTRDFPVASGVKRTGKRLLTIGTDVSVGKMYTSLAIWREMEKRDMKTTFSATGQTGIFIAGDGVSVDAVVADFISGASEWLSPDADEDHWHVVEGQGSLYHTSYAGVTLGLIHGSQPDALVICHDAARKTARGLGDKGLPSFEDVIEAGMWAAKNVNPNVEVVGVSINTKSLDDAAAEALMKATEDRLGLPCVDAVRTGVAPIVDKLV